MGSEFHIIKTLLTSLPILICLSILQQDTKFYKILYINTIKYYKITCSIKHTVGSSVKVIIKWSRSRSLFHSFLHPMHSQLLTLSLLCNTTVQASSSALDNYMLVKNSVLWDLENLHHVHKCCYSMLS